MAFFELSSLLGSTSLGLVINGIASNDWAGSSVSSAGDINGDGREDLIIGAHWANPSGRSNAGQSYVIFDYSSSSTGPWAIGSVVGGIVGLELVVGSYILYKRK